MDLNKFGRRAYKCAIKRGKIEGTSSLHELHKQTVDGLTEEVSEVTFADEVELSDHLKIYTAVAEELADVAITAFTELFRRGVDIEAILHAKMKYNEQR